MAKKNIWTGEGYLWGDDEKDPYGALNPEQVQVNKALGNTLLNNIGRNYSYTGQLSAPISQGEQDVVANSARYNAIANPTYDTLSTYDPASVNRDFDTYIQNPTMKNFFSEIEPYLAQELPSFGTARANVVARQAASLAGQLGTNRMSYQQQARDTALNAIAGRRASDVSAMQIAQVPRLIQQSGLDREYLNFVQSNQDKKDSLNQALTFLGLSTGTFQQGPNPYEILINAGKTGAQIAAAA